MRIGPDIPLAIVSSPRYFRQHPPPTNPDQLVEQRCINLRLSTSGTLNAWRFVKGGRETRVVSTGRSSSITIDLILDAALDGLGLAYLPSDQVEKLVKSGKLRGVLRKWTQPLPGLLSVLSEPAPQRSVRLVLDACSIVDVRINQRQRARLACVCSINGSSAPSAGWLAELLSWVWVAWLSLSDLLLASLPTLVAFVSVRFFIMLPRALALGASPP